MLIAPKNQNKAVLAAEMTWNSGSVGMRGTKREKKGGGL